jgi:hypothetical protein
MRHRRARGPGTALISGADQWHRILVAQAYELSHVSPQDAGVIALSCMRAGRAA